jgi:hypothetical protein
MHFLQLREAREWLEQHVSASPAERAEVEMKIEHTERAYNIFVQLFFDFTHLL